MSVTDEDRAADRATGAAPNGRRRTQDDDAYWQRPSADAPSLPRPAGAASKPATVPYEGPPRSTPPPPDWRPRVVVPTVEPREMPTQDHRRLDAADQAARTVSNGIGLVAAAVVVILIFVLCARIVG